MVNSLQEYYFGHYQLTGVHLMHSTVMKEKGEGAS
jgi:hypothetical protein